MIYWGQFFLSSFRAVLHFITAAALLIASAGCNGQLRHASVNRTTHTQSAHSQLKDAVFSVTEEEHAEIIAVMSVASSAFGTQTHRVPLRREFVYSEILPCPATPKRAWSKNTITFFGPEKKYRLQMLSTAATPGLMLFVKWQSESKEQARISAKARFSIIVGKDMTFQLDNATVLKVCFESPHSKAPAP